MSRRSRFLLAVAGVVALGASVTGCSDGATSMHHVVKVDIESIDKVLHKVGADDANVYGFNHLTGAGTDSDGSKVDVEMLATVDYNKGTGPFEGVLTFTFANGDTLGMRMVSGKTVAATDTTDATFASKLEVIDGTGGHLGSSGKGTFVGARKDALGGLVQATFDMNVVVAG